MNNILRNKRYFNTVKDCRKKSKTFIAIIVAAIICLLTIMLSAGCSHNDSQSSKTDTNNTKTIRDIHNREVNVPIHVNKIATVGSATRLCVYAGATDKLVAITEMDKPSTDRPYTVANQDILASLLTTSNGNHINSTTVNEEALLKLSPDVIISTRSADECNKLQNNIKIPVVGVYFQDTIFGEELIKSINITAETANTQEHAQKIIQFLKNTQTDLDNRCRGTSSPNIYRGAVNFRGSKDITGTISHYCVYDAIHAKNAASRDDIQGAYDTSLEQILKWNPQYIFMDYSNKGKVDKNKQDNPGVFANIDAFKNKNVHYVASFNNNGTNVEYGICEAYYTAKMIYPDKFSNINLDEKFDEIFDNLLGRKIYGELKSSGVVFKQATD